MEGTTRSLAWWLLVTCAFCFTRVANAQISPGPLARPHEGLSGAANCIKCHEVSTKWGEMGFILPRREAVVVRDARQLEMAGNEDS